MCVNILHETVEMQCRHCLHRRHCLVGEICTQYKKKHHRPFLVIKGDNLWKSVSNFPNHWNVHHLFGVNIKSKTNKQILAKYCSISVIFAFACLEKLCKVHTNSIPSHQCWPLFCNTTFDCFVPWLVCLFFWFLLFLLFISLDFFDKSSSLDVILSLSKCPCVLMSLWFLIIFCRHCLPQILKMCFTS